MWGKKGAVRVRRIPNKKSPPPSPLSTHIWDRVCVCVCAGEKRRTRMTKASAASHSTLSTLLPLLSPSRSPPRMWAETLVLRGGKGEEQGLSQQPHLLSLSLHHTLDHAHTSCPQRLVAITCPPYLLLLLLLLLLLTGISRGGG